MKKLFILFLVTVMCFSMVACGGDSSSSSEPLSEPDAATEPVDEQAEAQEALKDALSGGSVLFYQDVRNDTTGRWRLLVYNSSKNIVDYAVDYYEAFFTSDDEIHIVVNRGLQTTTVVKILSGLLFVDVHEYVDNEEHDAKVLGGGMLLESYIIDPSTGEIEDVLSE